MCFGERLWVRPSWSDPPPGAAADVVLDPGLAFGTGGHESTALCLEWLDGAALAGARIIDYGCGSGVLAIAALKLGALHAYAVDADHQALAVAKENAIRNGVERDLTLVPPERLGECQADLLLANILARPLVELAEHFSSLVRPGGRLVLSGIIGSQTTSITTAYSRWFVLESTVARGEWVRVTGTRRD